MNRVLLLLLSVLTLNLFGKIFPPELRNTSSPTHFTPASPASKNNQTKDAFQSIQSSMLMDTVPPILNCPANETFTLIHKKCDTLLTYTVTATDDQGPAIVIQLSGLPSGSVFPKGVHTCVYLATDLAGNTATCSFALTVRDTGIAGLICDDLLEVQLDSNCAKTILPQEFLQGGPYGCPDRYLLEVDKTTPFGNGPWLAATVGALDEGKTFQARVTDIQTGNKCWGNLKIEDKLGPVLICKDLTVSCAEQNVAPEFLKDSIGISTATPTATDACSSISFLGHVDNNFPFNCDSFFTGIIRRQWQANDLKGNSSTCIQQIKKHRHTLSELQLPPNITLSCPDTSTNPAITGWPFLVYQGRRYDLENNAICDLSTFYQDISERLPCGDIRIRRQWEYFDFCTSVTEGPFEQTIYLLDQTGPTIACPASLMITLNADTCFATIDLPDAVLDDVCSQIFSFDAFWEVNGLAKTLSGSLSDFTGNNTLDPDTLGVLGMALLPVGTTTISYVAEDSCGNIGDCSFNITLADMVKPIAHCDTFSTFQLTTDGLLSVAASALDNGSSDACTPISFKARFVEQTACLFDTIWTDTLRFCCLNQNDTLDAILRVYDVPTPFGIVTSGFGSGHYTDCAMKIVITDPNPPSCLAPQNLTVSCENFDKTLQSYGSIASTSCAVDSFAIKVDYTQFDTVCNRGNILRIFEVFDAAGNIEACAQGITVNYLQDYYTKFPDDVIVTACNATGIYGEPIFYGQDCEQFEVTFTDQIFSVVPDACYKIERTWKITNRCSYDPAKPLVLIPNPTPNAASNHPTNLPGPIVSACNALPPWSPSIVKILPTDSNPTNYCTFYSDTANGYEYKQIIKIVDIFPPTGTYAVPACTNQNWATNNNPLLWNESFWNDPVIGVNDLSEEPTELSITGTDACSGSNINIEYLLFLDTDGNGSTETVVNSVNVGSAGLGWNRVLFDNLNTPNFTGGTPRAFDERPVMANQKMGFAIEETVLGNNKMARVRWNTEEQPGTYFTPELPHGTHKIKWFLTDNCGNNKEYEYSFTIRDCKPPTVECLNNLSINILPTGTTQLFASDLLQFKEDNCTPEAQIKIGIRKCGTGIGFPLNPVGNPILGVLFTCAEVDTQCVELWALDLAGNAEKCVTNVLVLDGLNNCPGGNGSNIEGYVKTEDGAGIENVSITIEGQVNFLPPFSYFFQGTDSTGYYAINGNNQVPIASTFLIKPELDDNPRNGVTTFDLVLISKHILGLEPLNSPYKMIAADANKSGSITTFDMVELRKLILGIYTEMPNNTSWRFVDSSFVFPNPLNPFETGFPDTIPIANILNNMDGLDFIGMKVGDVNNTAVPHFNGAAEERYEGSIYLDVEDRTVQEGEIFYMKFTASELLKGCQFTLEAAGLEILDILPGAGMNKDNFAVFPQKSLLTMAWETGGQAVFSLKFKAQKAGALHEMLKISSQLTRAEAYPLRTESNAKSRLALRFDNVGSAFVLFQNQPNPFAKKTAISFQLPEASSAVLSILDLNGKILWSKSSDWPAGLNTVELDLEGISATGVLYYKLETTSGSAVRKMVRI